MSVETKVKYDGKLRCSAVHTPSGAQILTDAPLDNGGRGEAFSPTDLVAAAFGTCAMTIMGLVAERSGLNLSGTEITVTKEMASEPARRIGSLKAVFTFPANLSLSDVDKRKIEGAVNACPVRQSLHPDVKIESKFVYE